MSGWTGALRGFAPALQVEPQLRPEDEGLAASADCWQAGFDPTTHGVLMNRETAGGILHCVDAMDFDEAVIGQLCQGAMPRAGASRGYLRRATR